MPYVNCSLISSSEVEGLVIYFVFESYFDDIIDLGHKSWISCPVNPKPAVIACALVDYIFKIPVNYRSTFRHDVSPDFLVVLVAATI